MISETLEKDLRAYAKRRNKKLFEEKIYAPLVHLVNWIVSKEYNHCTITDKQDVTQMVLIRITKDMKHYKEDKGTTAVSFVRMLISQELHKNKRRFERRNVEVEYNTEADDRATDADTYRVTIEEMIGVLAKYRDEVTGDSVRVVDALIAILKGDYMEWIKAKSITRVAMIKERSKTTNQCIIDTLADIRDAGLMSA